MSLGCAARSVPLDQETINTGHAGYVGRTGYPGELPIHIPPYFALEGAFKPPPIHLLAGIDPTFCSLRPLMLHITDQS